MNKLLVALLLLVLVTLAVAQQPDAKVESSSVPPNLVGVVRTTALSTGRYWRLMAEALAARQQANDTPQAKAAAEADAAVNAEGAALAKECRRLYGEKYQPSIDQDATSPTFKDIICYLPPAPPSAGEKGK